MSTGARAAPGGRLVEVRKVSVVRGGRRILDHVDLWIDQGEIVTLIGPNGAGKSTLCRVVLRVLAPDEGEVRRSPGLRLGYVPQRFTVEGVIPLSLSRFLTLTCRLGAGEIEALLEEVGIAHLREADVASLSGGEFQRAALARALARRPNLLVLDEPAQGVDLVGEGRLYELIGRIRDAHGCAVLMVSHDLRVVMAESDRVICLNGHICCQGMPESVAAHPEYGRLFGATVSPALGVYAHDHDHVHEVSGRVRKAPAGRADARREEDADAP